MTDSKTATELLEELRDLACDMNAKEIIEHIQLYPTCVFKDKWLDSWHREFDRITQAISATLSSDLIAELKAEVERLRRAGYEVGYHDAMKALGGGECEFKPFRGPISDMDEIGDRQGVCSECSAYMHEQFNFCPNCGKAVKR